jgi:hypothetical protein
MASFLGVRSLNSFWGVLFVLVLMFISCFCLFVLLQSLQLFQYHDSCQAIRSEQREIGNCFHLELISKLRYRNVCKRYRETERAAEFRIETTLTHFGALCLSFEQILGTRLESHSVAILGYLSAVDCE